MVRERGLRVEIPLFNEAATALKETGRFEKDLTASEVGDIMRGVIAGLLGGQERVEASVPLMNVRIANSQGRVSGTVQVERPITAQIGVNCALANGSRSGELRLADLTIDQEVQMRWPARKAAEAILKKINLEKRVRQALQNPNQALLKALSTQLEPQGVQVTGIGLTFLGDKDALRIILTGGKTR